ncbi:hypothetical protein Ae201684P_019080 [Aphanomyces euteiches]|nr:hypothetical protein Ae201684P_019080 [Aphanomyces euteiches]
MGCADGRSRLPTEVSLELIQTSDSYRYDGQHEEWVLQDTVFMAASITSNQNDPVDPTERNPGFPTPTRIDSNPITSDPDSQNPAVPPIPDPRTDLPSPEGGSYDIQSDGQVTSIPVDSLPKYTAVTYRLPSKLLRDEQAKDLFIQAVKGYIEENAIPTDPEVLQILIQTGKHFTMDKKILYRRTILTSPLRNPTVTKVPVIPVSMILTVLELCHDSSLSGHFGVTRTIDRVKRIGYWKGWRDDVIDYCRKCLRCGAAKGTRPWKNGLMQRLPVYKLRGPFSFLVVDALGPFPLTPQGNRYVLIFVDYFTRWPEAFAVPDLKTSTFIRILVDEIVCRYGVPNHLLSDRGTNFVSDLAKNMYKILGIDKLASAPMHPQGQGCTSTPCRLIGISTCHDYSGRTDPRTLGDSPFFCLFGRDPVQPLDQVFLNQDPLWKSDELPQWRRQQSALFQATRQLVENQLIEGQNKSARSRSDQSRVEFEPADSVWVYQNFRKTNDPDDKRIKKLAFDWHGPYRIFKKQGDNTYRIYLPSHPDRIVPINVDRIKKFQGYWSRPYDNDIPRRLAGKTNEDDVTNPGQPLSDPAQLPDSNGDPDPSEIPPEPDPFDSHLDPDFLPASSYVDKVDYPDGDLAYCNTTSPILEILDKRHTRGKEIQYLVRHVDENTYWTPRSRLKEYASFVREYEDKKRAETGLPPLRRSKRLMEMDLSPEEPML